jgi:hypothetical protein
MFGKLFLGVVVMVKGGTMLICSGCYLRLRRDRSREAENQGESDEKLLHICIG